ncbi:MAG TPA: prolyl oligopeptidase family serine peptidase [Ktedonobacteraceae bacterium]|nr:prolyl oligopeptidase family serine peptidase [Ktedonobacteraceae bacterium]
MYLLLSVPVQEFEYITGKRLLTSLIEVRLTLISLAGVVDLEMAWKLHLSNDAVVELMGGSFPNAPERYASASPAAMLPLGVPQVLIHGTSDSNVPIEISRKYTREAKTAGDPVTYLELEGIDHFDVINPRSSAWERTMEILQTLVQ